MKSFTPLAALLLGAAVLGITAESPEELSSDQLDCLEEYHPLFKEASAVRAKCDEEAGVSTRVGDPFGPGEGIECVGKVLTPEYWTRFLDAITRCKQIYNAIPESQNESVKKLLSQDVWSRVI